MLSAPNLAEVGSGALGIEWGTTPLGVFLAESVVSRVDFRTPADPKWVQNRTFEARSELGPSKNGLREGFRKKHEKSMKNGLKNH